MREVLALDTQESDPQNLIPVAQMPAVLDLLTCTQVLGLQLLPYIFSYVHSHLALGGTGASDLRASSGVGMCRDQQGQS